MDKVYIVTETKNYDYYKETYYEEISKVFSTKEKALKYVRYKWSDCRFFYISEWQVDE